MDQDASPFAAPAAYYDRFRAPYAPEALEYLAVRPDGVYIDATAGLGGHTGLIAARLTTGLVIANDRDDLVDRAPAERQVAVDAGSKLTNISGAEKNLVTGDLGVGRGLAEGGDEELRPTLHIALDCSGVRRGKKQKGTAVS